MQRFGLLNLSHLVVNSRQFISLLLMIERIQARSFNLPTDFDRLIFQQIQNQQNG